MSKVDKPNYTQLPNAILDSMNEMEETEFRVVVAIARKTFGWHKREDELSLSQLKDITGLSRPSVIKGVEIAIKNGWITRRPKGQSFMYSILVNDVDQLVNDVDQLGEKLVNDVDTQKKESKETIKKERVGAKTMRPADPRSSHPSIVAIRQITGRFPSKDIYDLLIQSIGEHPRLDDLKTCFETWRGKGWRADNFAWITEWYVNGIPIDEYSQKGKPSARQQNGTYPRRNQSARPVEAEWKEADFDIPTRPGTD